MRGLVVDAVNPHPVGSRLPGIYQDDSFTQRLCTSLDEVLAPVIQTLDCLPAYLDPSTTPDDMLAWLAGWVGIVLEPGQSRQRQREVVAAGIALLAWRGTVRGVRDSVQILTGVVPEVIETGGTEWSASPGAAMPGTPGARITVRVVVEEPNNVDARRIDDVVTALKPAHVRHRVEVVASG